jgi:hypothetical protein
MVAAYLGVDKVAEAEQPSSFEEFFYEMTGTLPPGAAGGQQQDG